MLGERENDSEEFKQPRTAAKTRAFMRTDFYCILTVSLIIVFCHEYKSICSTYWWQTKKATITLYWFK